MSYIPDAISVVIPTYNRANLIKASIQSVLDQTLQPYEIIVVDDFSTDNTQEVVNSFNSPLIKYVKNQRKKGANGARNTGILMAKGEFIAFHDSDDIWLKDKLIKQFEIIKVDKSIDLCFCSLKTETKIKTPIIVPRRKVNSDEIKNLLLRSNFISTQTIFIKKNIAVNNLFDENLKRLQDWDFVLRLSDKNIHHLNEALAIQHINLDSISKNVNVIEPYREIFEKFPHIKNIGIYNKVAYLKIKINDEGFVLDKIKLFFFNIFKLFVYIVKVIF